MFGLYMSFYYLQCGESYPLYSTALAIVLKPCHIPMPAKSSRGDL